MRSLTVLLWVIWLLESGCGSVDDTAHAPAALQQQSVSDIGCADGEREGFVNRAIFPDIAGCSGGWSIPGIHTHNPGQAPACPGLSTFDTRTPACTRSAGDDSSNPQGAGCNVEDLCAPSWHVCESARDVHDSSPQGCVGAVPPNSGPYFFATRQTGTGCAVCATGSDPSCASESCRLNCLQTSTTANDVFGCGNFGFVASRCSGLDRTGANTDSG